MADNADTTTTARIALACLDLTSLNDGDTEADIDRLCRRALGPHGRPAAVCVWPRLAAHARAQLPADVRVAAVANFPAGGHALEPALNDVAQIVGAGAQEVDVVLPWRALAAGDAAACAALLAAVRRESAGLALKVIIESGELADAALIAQASRIALDAGADFIKTSTGKTPHGASPAAARVMLLALQGASRAAGFKASGGVRTLADARVYIDLVQELLGPQALNPQRFRIGASGLLDVIEAELGGAAPAAVQATGY